jgi:hypothetical protein
VALSHNTQGKDGLRDVVWDANQQPNVQLIPGVYHELCHFTDNVALHSRQPHVQIVPGAYLKLSRTWVPGDVIVLMLDMRLRAWTDATDWKTPHGSSSTDLPSTPPGRTCIYRGPLLLTYDLHLNQVEPSIFTGETNGRDNGSDFSSSGNSKIGSASGNIRGVDGFNTLLPARPPLIDATLLASTPKVIASPSWLPCLLLLEWELPTPTGGTVPYRLCNFGSAGLASRFVL